MTARTAMTRRTDRRAGAADLTLLILLALLPVVLGMFQTTLAYLIYLLKAAAVILPSLLAALSAVAFGTRLKIYVNLRAAPDSPRPHAKANRVANGILRVAADQVILAQVQASVPLMYSRSLTMTPAVTRCIRAQTASRFTATVR